MHLHIADGHNHQGRSQWTRGFGRQALLSSCWVLLGKSWLPTTHPAHTAEGNTHRGGCDAGSASLGTAFSHWHAALGGLKGDSVLSSVDLVVRMGIPNCFSKTGFAHLHLFHASITTHNDTAFAMLWSVQHVYSLSPFTVYDYIQLSYSGLQQPNNPGQTCQC